MSKTKWIVGVLALIIASWLIWGWLNPMEESLPAEAESRLAYVRDVYQDGRQYFLAVDYWVGGEDSTLLSEDDNLPAGIDTLKLSRGVEITLKDDSGVGVERFKQAISEGGEPWSETVFTLWLMGGEVIKIESFVIPTL